MATLRIEHPVRDFDAWKQAFDGDPIGRERSGVSRYRVFRGIDEPDYVMIDLEFGTPTEAEAMLESLRGLWQGVAGSIISDPKARIVETVETVDY